MATKIYGASDDLIEFEGDVSGESGGGRSTEDGDDSGTMVCIDDGTVLDVQYGKPGGQAIWQITVLNKGALFDHIDVCTDEDAKPHSDIVYLKDGAKKGWVSGSGWKKVD